VLVHYVQLGAKKVMDSLVSIDDNNNSKESEGDSEDESDKKTASILSNEVKQILNDGKRASDTAYYFGSAYFLKPNDKARIEFEKFRNHTGTYLNNVIKNKPIIKTHQDVVNEMKESEKLKKGNLKEQSYLGLSSLLRLPYFDIVRCVRNDFMHLTCNVTKALFHLVLNQKTMRFTEKKREMEKLLGREYKSGQTEFQMSSKFRTIFSTIHSETNFPYMHGNYGRKRNFFNDNDRLKTSDIVFLATQYGEWIIESSDIQEPYKSIILRLVASAKLHRLASFVKSELPEMDHFVTVSNTMAETKLPHLFLVLTFISWLIHLNLKVVLWN